MATAVQQWIEYNQNKGYTKEQIKEKMLEYGYSTEAVNQALGIKAPSNRNYIIGIVAAVVVVLVVAVLVLW